MFIVKSRVITKNEIMWNNKSVVEVNGTIFKTLNSKDRRRKKDQRVHRTNKVYIAKWDK